MRGEAAEALLLKKPSDWVTGCREAVAGAPVWAVRGTANAGQHTFPGESREPLRNRVICEIAHDRAFLRWMPAFAGKVITRQMRSACPQGEGKLFSGHLIGPCKHDIGISVHGLIAAFATPRDMAAALGKRGGRDAEAKRASARANGAKGGRPSKICQTG